MTDMTEPQPAPNSPDAPANTPAHHVLPVLPHSGKVEQMRREARVSPAADKAEAASAASPSPTRTPASAPAHAPAGAPTKPAASAAPAGPSGTGDGIGKKLLEAKVIEVLHQIYDPEIPVSIYELGLIYAIDVRDDNSVKVQMTLTAPACPVAGSLPGEVERKIESLPEVKSAEVELVWDPPWSRDRMSEAAQLQLGLF